ncbi:MAG: hypothetical protein ACT4OS_04065 [Acidimicrobiales bacterium]
MERRDVLDALALDARLLDAGFFNSGSFLGWSVLVVPLVRDGDEAVETPDRRLIGLASTGGWRPERMSRG